ncbi:hypothetical protein [Sphingomonas sp. PR090111-T3T-6A]|uniref:hypothetical protein n=1 Tax=Sphingomonas sp. PR090111-T3T-6A TaxID=685778 RepID=UPI000381B3BA|nr:hypothetical protein [Sphingomonas sp. PR090111-T3T-6A]
MQKILPLLRDGGSIPSKPGIPTDHLPNLEVALSETIPAGRLGRAQELAQAALSSPDRTAAPSTA